MFRFRYSQKRTSTNKGLGMPLVAASAMAHGGRVVVKSGHLINRWHEGISHVRSPVAGENYVPGVEVRLVLPRDHTQNAYEDVLHPVTGGPSESASEGDGFLDANKVVAALNLDQAAPTPYTNVDFSIQEKGAAVIRAVERSRELGLNVLQTAQAVLAAANLKAKPAVLVVSDNDDVIAGVDERLPSRGVLRVAFSGSDEELVRIRRDHVDWTVLPLNRTLEHGKISARVVQDALANEHGLVQVVLIVVGPNQKGLQAVRGPAIMDFWTFFRMDGASDMLLRAPIADQAANDYIIAALLTVAA